MKWYEIRNTILDIVGKCVKADTYWRDQQRPLVRPSDSNRLDQGVTCLLHAFATDKNGRDEFRREVDNSIGKLRITQTGNRRFTVSCLVESYDQSADRQALEYTERIRSAMERPQVLALFRVVNLTCVGVSSSTDLSHMEEDHSVSSASVDLAFSYAYNEQSEFGLDPIDWIETVEGTRVDPPGLDVPAPIDENLS